MVSCNEPSVYLETEPGFSDTVRICYDTDRYQNFTFSILGDSSIYCSAEINGVYLDTVLIDNGFYYSAISPNMAPVLNSSYTILDSITQKIIHEFTCKVCKADGLYMNVGENVYQLDTFSITPWQQLSAKGTTKAVIGRDFFEKYIVEINIRHGFMAWGNRLPTTLNDYTGIPMVCASDNHECPRRRNIKIDGFRLRDGCPIETLVFPDLGCTYTAFDNVSFLKRVDLSFSRIDTSSLAWLILNEIGMAVDSADFPVVRRENGRDAARVPSNIMDLSELSVDIILGTDFFCHFDVIFDYKNNMLYLKHNEQ